jgi:hypothetical protein
LRISNQGGVVPVTTVCQLSCSLATWAPETSSGATAATEGTWRWIASRSDQVSVGCEPAPTRAPRSRTEPERMKSVWVPMLSKVAATRRFAPSPIETIAITAPTPITMPSTVRHDRSLRRASAASAIWVVRTSLTTPRPSPPPGAPARDPRRPGHP